MPAKVVFSPTPAPPSRPQPFWATRTYAHTHTHERTCTRVHARARTHARAYAHPRVHVRARARGTQVGHLRAALRPQGRRVHLLRQVAGSLAEPHPPTQDTDTRGSSGGVTVYLRVKSQPQQTRAPRAARARGRCAHPALLVSCSLRHTPPQHTGTNARAKSNCAAIELREKDRAGECWPQVQMNIYI